MSFPDTVYHRIVNTVPCAVHRTLVFSHPTDMSQFYLSQTPHGFLLTPSSFLSPSLWRALPHVPLHPLSAVL